MMSWDTARPMKYRSLPRGLVILLFLHAVGLVTAWRESAGDDMGTSRLSGPMASMDDEHSLGYSQPVRHMLYNLIRRTSSTPHQPTAYDLLQHELWDKKMSAEPFDAEEYEARKWADLQKRVTDDYIERTIRYLLDGVERGTEDQPQERDYGYEGDSIDVQRRAGLPETCGRVDGGSRVAKRVVLGRESAEGRWTWLVQLTATDAKQPYCGGTLINGEFVLTAAHCFDRHEPKDVVVILGDRNRLKKEGTEQRFRIDCVYIHEDYIPKGDYKDDIALIRLKTGRRTVKMGPAVQPACLPPKQKGRAPDLFNADDKCFVVGWGFTDPLTYFNAQHPAILHEAKLPILPPKSCRDAYGDLYTDKMVCAGYMTGKQRTDACKGDSGGPLMCRADSGQWVAWGIVSWGHNYFCNGSPDNPIPTVYTKVEEYLPWLKRRLRLDQC